MLKSWCIGFFQLPWLPEALSSVLDFRILEEGMHRSAKPAIFPPEVMTAYKIAWRKPAALKAMINWYRAACYKTTGLNKPISTPTLLIWGKQDSFLKHEMARPSIEKCRDGRLVMIEDASHWLQHEKPKQVNSLIEGFIQ